MRCPAALKLRPDGWEFESLAAQLFVHEREADEIREQIKASATGAEVESGGGGQPAAAVVAADPSGSGPPGARQLQRMQLLLTAERQLRSILHAKLDVLSEVRPDACARAAF